MAIENRILGDVFKMASENYSREDMNLKVGGMGVVFNTEKLRNKRTVTYKQAGVIVVALLFTVLTSFVAVGQEEADDPKSLMSSYYNDGFEPFGKKNWFASFSMSLKNEDQSNVEQTFQTVLDGRNENYDIKLSAGYYFTDNFAATVGFEYIESKFIGTSVKRNDTIDMNSLNTTYGIAPSLRTSIPVVPSQRLSLYVDLGVNFNWGNTVKRDYYDDGTITKSFADNYAFGVGVNPGVTFFVMQNFAIELGLNVLGYNYTVNKIKNDDGPDSVDQSHEIDFKLNLLKLNMSLTYYIGAKN
jgi:hypothetical protein